MLIKMNPGIIIIIMANNGKIKNEENCLWIFESHLYRRFSEINLSSPIYLQIKILKDLIIIRGEN